MDYKEKYEKAVKAAMLAKQDTESAVTIRILEEIFPELRESEDEKIRKELLDFCKNRAENYPNDPKYKNISAWIAWLEKQGKQKSIDDLTQQEAMDIAVAKCFEQGEQKPTDKVEPKWSKEDEKLLKKIMYILSLDGRISNKELQEMYDFLKTLRPQNTWKPGEEQIKLLEELVEDNNQRHFHTLLESLYEQLKRLT